MSDRSAPKILIVRLSALGDVVQSLPVLAHLRRSFPSATLGWLVEADACELLRGNPILDRLHVSHRKRWVKSLKNPLQWGQTYTEVRGFFREIQEMGYDVAIDLQGLLKSGLTLYLTGIKRRVGLACAREMAPFFYTQKMKPNNAFFDVTVPIIQHFEALATAIGGDVHAAREYPLPKSMPEMVQRVDSMLDDIPGPLIAMAPATQWESKHWPSAYWTQLIQRVLEQTRSSVILVGGKKDTALNQAIIAAIPADTQAGRVYDFAGKTSLQELQVLLGRVDLIVGLDSAPLHLAGAVGKSRLIGIYGPTAYRRTPPPGDDRTILLSTEEQLSCQPCDQTVCPLGTMACMVQLTPDTVFTALLKQLHQNAILR